MPSKPQSFPFAPTPQDIRLEHADLSQAGNCADREILRPLGPAKWISRSSFTHPDVILIPGGGAGTFAIAKDNEIIDWLRHVGARARFVTSVCSGALVLGAAGFLKSKKATTHWFVADRLARFGATYLQERVVHDGNVVTAQGVSAGLDMGLYLASQLADRDTAEAIQLILEYDPRPPWQS